MCAWSPNGYYNFLLKCTIKIRVHALEREASVQGESNYEIKVGHCITFKHCPAVCKALTNSVFINKLEKLKYLKYDIWKRPVREKKNDLIKKDCFSLEASKLSSLLGMGI